MALCLGTAQLAQKYGIFKKPDHETSFDILSAAFDCGIEYIDTAPTYGEAEHVIGEFLKSNGLRAKIITKIPKFMGTDPKLFIDHCKRSAIDSMRALGRNQLWGVLLHDAQNAKDFWNELLGLKTWFLVSGVTSNFGVSLYDPEDLGYRFLGLYQIPMNMMDTRFMEVPKEDFFWGGNTIMVRSVYLQGKIQEHRKALAFVKKAIGKMTRHNLIVLGCENADQVKANANMFNNDLEISEDEYNQILEGGKNPDMEKVDPRRWK